MKVKCIKSHHSGTLTIGKVYKARRISNYSYLVENDKGEMRLYMKEYFEEVQDI